MIRRDPSPHLRERLAKVSVACPSCGGAAEAEAAPVTIYRDGLTRTVQMVICGAGCRQPARRFGTVAARFEIEITKEENTVMGLRKTDLQEAERERVAEAIKASGKSKSYVSVVLGLGTALHEWLKTGRGLGPGKVEKLMEWAAGVEAGEAHPIKQAMKPLEGELCDADETSNLIPGRRQEPVVVETVISVDTKEAQKSIDEMVERLAALQAVEPGPSPADLMVQAVAERGALKELAGLGLDLPRGAKLTVALEWCA